MSEQHTSAVPHDTTAIPSLGPGMGPSVGPTPGEEPSSPRSGRAGRRGSAGRRAAYLAAGVLVGLAAIYGITYLAVGRDLPRGTTVLGIPVGGLSRDAAAAKLSGSQVAAQLAHPITLTSADDTLQVTPKDAGLSLDVPATLAKAGGGAGPVALWHAIAGGGSIDPVVKVDQNQLTSAVKGVADQLQREPVDGSIAFAGGKAQVTEPVDGRQVDTATTAKLVAAAFPSTDTVALPLKVVKPAIDSAAIDKALQEFGTPAMSGPVTVVAGAQQAVLTPTVLSQAVTVSAENGTLTPKVDGAKLLAAGAKVFGTIGNGAKDASVVIRDNAPVVVPGSAGTGVAPDALGAAVLAALTKSGNERTATVELTSTAPKVTTEAVQAMGVKQVVSEFTTKFPYAEYRNINIGGAAAKIDNTFLKPGDTFSLNGIVGERTAANGFTTGWTIQNGVLKEDLGGGVSQLATTTFNAAYRGGFEDVQHRAHTLYFSRYPAGVEATVAWPSLDLKFKNDSPYGVVVDTVFTAAAPGQQGVITVKLWSSPYWTTTVATGQPYAQTPAPAKVYDSSPQCQAQDSHAGFQIDTTRTRSSADKGTLTDKVHVVYSTAAAVGCGAPPA